MTEEQADKFDRLAHSIDALSMFHRALARRVMPLQLFVCLLQLVVCGVLVVMYMQIARLGDQARRTTAVTEELAERPQIELHAESSSSAVLVVAPPASGAPSIKIPVQLQPK